MVSNRAIVEAQRAGYVAGARAGYGGDWSPFRQEAVERTAAHLYPMPTVEVPREIRLGDNEYKVEGGRLWTRWMGNSRYAKPHQREWRESKLGYDALRQLCDLFLIPTETREVE